MFCCRHVSSPGWEQQKIPTCSPSKPQPVALFLWPSNTQGSPFSDLRWLRWCSSLVPQPPERNRAQYPLQGVDTRISHVSWLQAVEAKCLAYGAKMLEDSFHTAVTHKVVVNTGRASWEHLSTSISSSEKGSPKSEYRHQEYQKLPSVPGNLITLRNCHPKSSGPLHQISTPGQWFCNYAQGMKQSIRGENTNALQHKWLYLLWDVRKFKSMGTLENTDNFGCKKFMEVWWFLKANPSSPSLSERTIKGQN